MHLALELYFCRVAIPKKLSLAHISLSLKYCK